MALQGAKWAKLSFPALCLLILVWMGTDSSWWISSKVPVPLPHRSNLKPLRILLASTWRSGSTFVSEVLLSSRPTFYHYEPLLQFEIKQIRGGEEARQSIDLIRQLFACNYTNLDWYLETAKVHPELFAHNTVLWETCDNGSDEKCYRPRYLEDLCSGFEVQVMKTVRLRLHLIAPLLEAPQASYDLRVIFLYRDPRATVQSRKHRTWCPGNPDCEDPRLLCSDLWSDYLTYKYLKSKYPTKVQHIKYEDFSSDVFRSAGGILEFAGLEMNDQVVEYLNTHTSANKGGVSSTFRDSKWATSHWKEDLEFAEIDLIQKSCAKVMEALAYEPLSEEAYRAAMAAKAELAENDDDSTPSP